jgi:alpha-glucosidase
VTGALGDRAWWRDAVIYQIYPRSFADSNGDGVGDLPGITNHLDYLAELGVDALWLSPFYPSPMADFGYDVANHTDVDPLFGTLPDFDELLAAAHARNLRVIIDWVPNHTSHEHPWFVESSSSRSSPRRDWYVWRDSAADGGPPNNWQSQFPRVGSAWTWHESSGQWYLHSYLPEQPDLDWDNPAVVSEMCDVLRFWLRRGMDGFRIDIAHRLGKDPALTNNPALINEPDARYAGLRFDEDHPSALDRLRTIRSVIDEFEHRLIVGEVYLLNQRRLAAYVNGGDGLHLAHNFTFLRLPWDSQAFRQTIAELDGLLEPTAWPAWCLGNHDHDRIATRYDQGGHGGQRARLAALLLLTLRGTPFVYQGDELGLPNSEIPPGLASDIHDRDPVRGPMPWRPPSVAGAGAGFSNAAPWLPVAGAAEILNVDTQAGDPLSMLSFVRQLTRLRRRRESLRGGQMRLLGSKSEVLEYVRASGSDRLAIALNFGTNAAPLQTIPALAGSGGVELSTVPARALGPQPLRELSLAPLEGIVLSLPEGGG